MSATCKSALLTFLVLTALFIHPPNGTAFAELLDREDSANYEQVMACQDASSGKISYRAAVDVAGDPSCRKLSPSSGTFNQVRDFNGYRASLESENEDISSKSRVRKKGELDGGEGDSANETRRRSALTSFDFDELQSKRNPKKYQCHVEGETKVNKGCRVEIELIRGALTTVSFSRLGRSSSNTVKWKRVLEGECRDLTVRAVVSGCE